MVWMDAVDGNGKRERNPCVSTSFSLCVEEKPADAGRDGVAKSIPRDPGLRRKRGEGNIHFSCSADRDED